MLGGHRFTMELRGWTAFDVDGAESARRRRTGWRRRLYTCTRLESGRDAAPRCHIIGISLIYPAVSHSHSDTLEILHGISEQRHGHSLVLCTCSSIVKQCPPSTSSCVSHVPRCTRLSLRLCYQGHLRSCI